MTEPSSSSRPPSLELRAFLWIFHPGLDLGFDLTSGTFSNELIVFCLIDTVLWCIFVFGFTSSLANEFLLSSILTSWQSIARKFCSFFDWWPRMQIVDWFIVLHFVAAAPHPASVEPSTGVLPALQNCQPGASSIPSSAQFPSATLVINPQPPAVLHLQLAAAPQVLNLQLADSTLAASPGRSSHPTRPRTRRPIAAPTGTRGRHRPRHGGQMIW